MLYPEIAAEGSIVKYTQNGNMFTEKLQRANSIEIYRMNANSDTAVTTVGPLNFFGSPQFQWSYFHKFQHNKSTHNNLRLRVGHKFFPITISKVSE
jgi:hypothetical protein